MRFLPLVLVLVLFGCKVEVNETSSSYVETRQVILNDYHNQPLFMVLLDKRVRGNDITVYMRLENISGYDVDIDSVISGGNWTVPVNEFIFNGRTIDYGIIGRSNWTYTSTVTIDIYDMELYYPFGTNG